MNKAEVKREEARIRRALDWLQRRLKLNYEWVLAANPDIEVFQVERSNRGVEDPLCFLLDFNPDMVHAQSLKDLRYDLYHEIIHAMTWCWWEAVKAGKPVAECNRLLHNVYEPAVYEIERRTRKYVVG
jgi:hypothetical protein